MFMFPLHLRVYLAPGYTDMRKSINGLSIMVESVLERDPFSGYLFVFCNRRRNMVKILYWDRNGFCLWCKRLERDRFRWPAAGVGGVIEIEGRELVWLVEGLDIGVVSGHGRVVYSVLS